MTSEFEGFSIIFNRAQDLAFDYIKEENTVPFIYKKELAITSDGIKSENLIKAYLYCVANVMASSFKNSHEWEWERGKSTAIDFFIQALSLNRDNTKEEVK